MTTSQARPQALRDYVTTTDAARDLAVDARNALVNAYSELVAALPPGFSAPSRPDVAGPLGRSNDVDAHCGTVADRFEEAGAGGYDLATADVDVPYTTLYSEERRRQLRQRAEEELARFRENVAAGSPDEAAAGELMATLGWMRFEIEHAADPHATAAGLIEAMGSGDLHEALAVFESQAHDIPAPVLTRDDWPIRGMQDLMFVVAMGLEHQPDRAARWAADLANRRMIPREPNRAAWALRPNAADGMALLGAFSPEGTSTMTMALFDELWTAGPLTESSLSAQLYDGATSPLQPTLMHAADDPALANEIVHHLLDTPDPHHLDHSEVGEILGLPQPTRFDSLFGAPSPFPDPRFADMPDELRGDVITASVNPALADPVRIDTAAALTEHYVDRSAQLTYTDGTTRGLAAATQPLLEAWNPYGSDNGQLLLSGHTAERAVEINNHLWTAIGEYGKSQSGVQGFTSALSGATTHHLVDARAAGIAAPTLAADTYPFEGQRLRELNRLYSQAASEMSGARFDAVVAALEDQDVDWNLVHVNALKDVVTGIMGEAPGGSALSGFVDAAYEYGNAYAQDHGHREVLSDTSNPFYTIEPVLDAQLIAMTVEAHPGLHAALYEQLHQAVAEGGFEGLRDLVLHPPPDNPELIELRALLWEQQDTIDLQDARDTDDETSSDGPD